MSNNSNFIHPNSGGNYPKIKIFKIESRFDFYKLYSNSKFPFQTLFSNSFKKK